MKCCTVRAVLNFEVLEYQETAWASSNGEAEPSWGATAAFEVLQYLLLERLRGEVVLPGGASQYFGYKMACDAAVVRRAKRGRKKWTTIILQVLCSGVNRGAFGHRAVVNMLQDAQSANKFAKVRLQVLLCTAHTRLC